MSKLKLEPFSIGLSIAEIEELCPPGEFRYFNQDSIPSAIHEDIRNKSAGCLMAVSACTDGLLVTVNAFSFDKGNVVDQRPHMSHILSNGTEYGLQWNHAKFPNRTVNLTTDQLQSLSLSATDAFPRFTNAPSKDAGPLSELDTEGLIMIVTGPFDILNKAEQESKANQT